MGDGSLVDVDGESAPWRVGTPVEEGDRLVTPDGAYAMLFFVSGIGGAEIEFDGVIVVEVDQNSEIEIRGKQRRRAPIDIHVVRGGVQAFFDAREHRDYILLSTPRGQMKVTGSHIFATHDLPGQPGSVFGTFDSNCDVTLSGGQTMQISRSQKVVTVKGEDPAIVGVTQLDVDHWDSVPNLHMASALHCRGGVRSAYAERTWIREYVTGDERLEDVANEGSSNIPDQQPEVGPSVPAVVGRLTNVRRTESQPSLRSSRGSRTFVDGNPNDGPIFDREAASTRLRRRLKR
jgi:hypothetical protein